VYEWRQGGAREIVVYPPLVHLPRAQVPRGQRGAVVRADQLQQQITPVIGGMREYVPGDLPSHIHWPTVARRQKLMVKEFDQEQAGALWIALDLSRAAYPAGKPLVPATNESQRYTQSSIVPELLPNRWESPVELAVVLAGSLAAQALAEGRSVGLLADDGRRRVVNPASGQAQLWRILEALVDAQATGATPLRELLRQGRAAHFGAARGAIAVVTPALDGAWLPELVPQHGRAGGALALLVTERERAAGGIAAQLATLGVRTQVFVVGEPLPLLNPPKPRAALRVSPLGRIVSVQGV
jgi:uncharacterized protein (DUF58 family)